VPTDPDTDLRNAQTLLTQGQVEEAVRTYVQLADDYWLEEKYSDAEAVYRRALEADSHHDHTLWQLADIAVRAGRITEARQYLTHLVDLRTLRGDEEGLSACRDKLQTLEATPDTAIRAMASGAVEIDLSDALADIGGDQ
jgi:tetratricopeptide (TPR) repeat protein